jgi:hypothetical protein
MKASTSSAANTGVRIKWSTCVSGLSGQPLCRVTGTLGTSDFASHLPDSVSGYSFTRWLPAPPDQ